MSGTTESRWTVSFRHRRTAGVAETRHVHLWFLQVTLILSYHISRPSMIHWIWNSDLELLNLHTAGLYHQS